MPSTWEAELGEREDAAIVCTGNKYIEKSYLGALLFIRATILHRSIAMFAEGGLSMKQRLKPGVNVICASSFCALYVARKPQFGFLVA